MLAQTMKGDETMIDGQKLRALMIQRRMTQGGLAKAAGLSRQTIDDALKGKASIRPNLRTLGGLCRALDVDAAAILKDGETA